MNSNHSGYRKNIKFKRRVGLWIFISVLVLTSITGALVYTRRAKNVIANTVSQPTTQNQAAYNLNLMNMAGKSGTYPVNQPTEFMFDIRDKNNKAIKDFATYQQEKMHFIVVRKDRTNFQDFHPSLDEATGMFTVKSLSLPTDGEYRIFANFSPAGAKKDTMGMLEEVAPYQDIKVGDLNKYTPQTLDQDRLTSTGGGFIASIVQPPGGDSAGSSASAIKFYTGQDGSIPISINKDGQPYRNLQNYLGSLGHMIALGPNLEFLHADDMLGDSNNQTGYMAFMLTFPKSGQYKLYLQTEANDQVMTNDFNLTVQDMPKANSSGSNDMSGMNM